MAATVRCYPRGLGHKLLELCENIKNKPRLDLRQKAALNPEWTDLQIFRSLPFDDPWVDAGIPSLFLYVWVCFKPEVPIMDIQKVIIWLGRPCFETSLYIHHDNHFVHFQCCYGNTLPSFLLQVPKLAGFLCLGNDGS